MNKKLLKNNENNNLQTYKKQVFFILVCHFCQIHTFLIVYFQCRSNCYPCWGPIATPAEVQLLPLLRSNCYPCWGTIATPAEVQLLPLLRCNWHQILQYLPQILHPFFCQCMRYRQICFLVKVCSCCWRTMKQHQDEFRNRLE